jgi:hypothetical protein
MLHFLNEFSTIANVVRLVREWLGWMGEDCEFRFKVRIDIGLSNNPPMKIMSPICDENE